MHYLGSSAEARDFAAAATCDGSSSFRLIVIVLFPTLMIFPVPPGAAAEIIFIVLRTHPLCENRKCPIADHDAEGVQYHVINIKYAYAQHYLHSLDGKSGGSCESERFFPCHVPVDERNKKSYWHKRSNISDQICTRNNQS